MINKVPNATQKNHSKKNIYKLNKNTSQYIVNIRKIIFNYRVCRKQQNWKVTKIYAMKI